MSYYQPPPKDPNAGIRTAGTIAIWVWILAAVVPLVLGVICVGLCLVGGIFGGSHGPAPTQ